ncbi:MAG: D-alanyl-D-alanine carboxypeptidase/D-alanyl-D-alanine-endopeptidase [Ignavibacterium sp.]|nr:D-alanyl-D-alanine carboxypeptidase/D-alanyl-D-alanine-endopeptidase [Ignavibacterium sp.]MDW8376375.1 D-alanyl-D-alanine carboxypeptidase/D-alanyl-D-alanine-endopeptidase [Ignavibacteriales bacterium]
MNKTLSLLILFFSISLLGQDTIKIITSDTTLFVKKYSIANFQKEVESLLNDENFQTANIGIYIKSLKNGETIFSLNENKLFIPASNIKLFTSAAALEMLGSKYNFTTGIYVNGEISYSTIYGDLVIKGGGDPTFSGRFYDGELFKVFDDWIDSLVDLGITNIRGNIVGDDNFFDDKNYGTGWLRDYESYWYSAPSGALSFNDNCIDLTIFYNKTYDSIIVRHNPELRGIYVINEIVPVSPGEASTNIDIFREPNSNKIKVFGTFSRTSDTLKTYSSIYNPTYFTLNALKNRIEARGLRVIGYTVDIDDYNKQIDYKKAVNLFNYKSPPLYEIIKVVNKGSQNFYAEQLLRVMGAELKGIGSFENGISVCKEWFSSIGLNVNHILMYDGSGLSPLNRVTPYQIVNLLERMYNSKNFLYFYNSLPIAGIDGTLSRRMKNTLAENRVRAKTGFISFARNLSGYAKSLDNEDFAFSILVNNFNVPVKLIENLQDKICVLLSSISRKEQ